MKRAWVEIDLNKIYENVKKIKKYTGKEFLAAVKANCYGMGMVEISKKIESIVDYFGVATIGEAIELREAGIKKKILVMGPILPEDVGEAVRNDITITLCNREVLREIKKVTEKIGKKATVHIKVDTGMGRIGLKVEEAKDFVEEVVKEKSIYIEGIFSHLATAEWKDKEYSLWQINRFKKVLDEIGSKVKFKYRHIENTPAILNLKEECRDFNLTRIGLLIFGVYTEKYLYNRLPLNFALKGFTRILFVKEVPKGTYLSYGISFCTKRKTKIATLGIGYGDGLRRQLSNRYFLRLNGKNVKIIGNICMDQTLIDVTGKDAKIGQKIMVFGERFDIENMAEKVGTVPQEILCGFGSKRMEKVYKNG
ncbi:MAG TPA: alanine racemase [Firmicutes bacterium]|nr:alanine racemase [Bacillota bacterium]